MLNIADFRQPGGVIPPLWAWLLVAAVALFSGLWTPSVLAETVAAERCLMCHGNLQDQAATHRAHGAGGGEAVATCTACHGASEAHAANPGQAPTVSFDAEADGSRTCLACHEEDRRLHHWTFSGHRDADVGCADCHRIHDAVDPVVERRGQFDVCTSCHLQQAADQMKFSRHPSREGNVLCSDCHAPHGGSAMNNLVAATVNDTCYQCHADKRGPFLFEHEPVQDDCTHCHLPHGSVHDDLLTARQPLLCQQCHIASRHPGVLYDSDRLSRRDINMIGQSCTNCHSQVHGGNHPASSTFRR